MPVAFEVAQRLGAPLDVFVVRKLGVPGHEELAMGAIASGGIRVLNEDVVYALPDAQSIVEMVTAIEREELKRRELTYRAGRPPSDLCGRTVILVDDGLATGATMRAAAAALRQQGAAKIIVAVPVGAPTTCREIRDEVDDILCLHTQFHSWASANTTKIFPKPATKKCASCSRPRPPGGQRPMFDV